MALFKVKGTIVSKIATKRLDLEKNLQNLFEANLEELLNIDFLETEYPTSFGGRIDTLGIDKNGAPSIIEYKKSQNDNVINQGLSYLRWLLDHKADFEILCQKKRIDIDIDWESPRVICIAESYSKFDLDTADILPITIELLRYQIHDENILNLEPENYQKVKIPTGGIIKKGKVRKSRGAELQKNYTVESHLKGKNEKTLNLFYRIREKILGLDQRIIELARAKYIAYKISSNFVDIVVKQYGPKIYLNVKSGQLNDPHRLARDLTNPKPIGHWGNGDYSVKLEEEEHLDSVFALVRQSYELNK